MALPLRCAASLRLAEGSR